MPAFWEVLPAARPETQGGKQNHAEDRLCNKTQFSVTLKPAAVEAVFLLYGWLAQCGRHQPPMPRCGVSPFKPANPALRTLSRKATFMSRELVDHNHPANETYTQLHSSVPKIAAGLVAWYVLMAWIFFDGDAQSSLVALPLAFITVLFLVVGLCFSGSFLVSYRHQPEAGKHPNEVPFRDWSTGKFAVWGSQQSAAQAATEILLPIAAAASLMTVMGIIYAIMS
jgi:hypothetical protein